MKEFIEIIKKLWENKKTRSLAILIIYVVFFVLVFTLIGNSNHSQVIEKPLDKLKNLSIIQVEFIGKDSFKVVDDKIIYNEVSYDIDSKPEELANYDINVYTTINIYNLISASILESTNYVDNSNTYLISSKDFENILYNNVVDSSFNIRITLNEKNITYVNIDLKEYYGYEVRIDLRS